jgi:prepilin-type N-terminal cleavage/methylation domain-containing protein
MVLQKFRYESKIRQNMNDRGFTLIELLITIAIIGVLAALATTAYIGTTKKAARSEAYSNLNSIRLLEEQFFAENATYTISLGNCAPDNPGNINTIQTGGGDSTNALPGFKPGMNLEFTYCIEQNIVLGGAAQATPPCFRASAFGNTGTRVAGDIFRIDCNNNTNF